MKINSASALGLAMLVSFGAILPAAAATTAAKPAAATTAPAKPMHYYVALKAKGPGCEIVEVKPETKMLVGKHFYKTESDAAKAMAGAKACKA